MVKQTVLVTIAINKESLANYIKANAYASRNINKCINTAHANIIHTIHKIHVTAPSFIKTTTSNFFYKICYDMHDKQMNL